MNKLAMLSILTLPLFTAGCMFVPAITSSKGDLQIISQSNDIGHANERFVVVSFWDYPTVNNDRGEVVITGVIVTESKFLDMKFPMVGYWMVWTPVFGTQHIAPEPGVMVFRDDCLPAWGFGCFEPEFGVKLCCQAPSSKHDFVIDLTNFEKTLYDEKRVPDYKYFFEEFLDKKKDLIKKMDKCKDITSQEKSMVIDKITKTAAILEVKGLK